MLLLLFLILLGEEEAPFIRKMCLINIENV